MQVNQKRSERVGGRSPLALHFQQHSDAVRLEATLQELVMQQKTALLEISLKMLITLVFGLLQIRLQLKLTTALQPKHPELQTIYL